MPSRSFKCSLDLFIDKLNILQHSGFYFKNGQILKSEEDLKKIKKPDDQDFWVYGNNKIYIYNSLTLIESHNIISVDNIHQGKVFFIDETNGGYFLWLYYFVSSDNNIDGELGRPSEFTINGNVYLASEDLKNHYNIISALMRRKRF